MGTVCINNDFVSGLFKFPPQFFFLLVHTRDIVNKVTNITVTGAAGAFEKEFNIMKENIDEVRQIIEAVGGSSENVKQLSEMLENIK